VTSSFVRYGGLLEHVFISFETKAACGRLIVVDARMKHLIAKAHALGYVDGPLSRSQWVGYMRSCKTAYGQFDDAWAEYVLRFTPDTADEADDKIRLVILDSTRQLQDLLTDFPNKANLLDW